MTTTDRRDATDAPAPSAAEQAVLDRIENAPACDESAVERVARALYESDRDPSEFWAVKWELAYGLSDDYRRRARAAVAALKPAPGTDTSTSTEDALHRVLDLADDIDGNFEIHGDEVARRIREAIAGATDD